MGKYFGTDGFRGEANKDLTAFHAFKIGLFLGWYYSKGIGGRPENYRARIVIGKDTRRSSYMFEDALSAGIVSAGADCYLLHVTSTPSVAYVAKTESFDCGVMISASHNSYTDNGIKLINANGEKMMEDVLEKVEAYIDGSWTVPLATGENIGSVIDFSAGRNRYVGFLISLASCSFRGWRVGLDPSNGSTWQIAKNVFDALGAETHVINNTPDGLNVNKNCGSTHIEGLKKLVKDKGLDIGFAFDGDADRCLAVDENGSEVNGDEIMYLCAQYMQKTGELGQSKVVTTVMSNMGLYKALDSLGIGYEKTAVGDRYVYENMSENGWLLGGEQSGHIIFKKYATTGDGILTAIQVMQAVVKQKTSLSKLTEGIKRYPQVLTNVVVTDKDEVMEHPLVQAAVAAEEKRLGSSGRVLLRKSGTEPVLRVMSEAENAADAQLAVDNIIKAMYEIGKLIKIK